MKTKRLGIVCLILSMYCGTMVWGQEEVTDPNDPNVPVVELDHPAIVIVSNGSTPAGGTVHPDWVDVNTIVEESVVRVIVPRLKAAGAKGIVEYGINKIIEVDEEEA